MKSINLKLKLPNNTPLDNATVFISQGSSPFEEIAAITNTLGQVSLPISRNGVYEISVLYENQKQQISLKITDKRDSFTLIWE